LQLARLDAIPAEDGAACDAVVVVNEAVALVRPLDVERAFRIDAPASARAAIAGWKTRFATLRAPESM
jgi:hypothetical protein